MLVSNFKQLDSTDSQKRDTRLPKWTAKPSVQQNTIPRIVYILQRRIDIHLPMVNEVDQVLEGHENESEHEHFGLVEGQSSKEENINSKKRRHLVSFRTRNNVTSTATSSTM